MRVFASHRLEWLFEQLKAQSVQGGPFARRWLIVPTKAMKGWIQQQFAQDPEVGVFAGFETLFLEEALGRLSGFQPLSREELALRIEPQLAEPRQAWQLADLFRDYATYGIGWWRRGKGEQMEVWRRIYSEREHWQVALRKRPEGAPDQIHLFAFAHLPPLFLDYLLRLQVEIYHLSPCSGYWGETDHPLLQSLGRLGQMQSRLLDEVPSVEDEVESELGSIGMESVEVHAAPSRWREVEVLHDWLMQRLQGDLMPSEVLVMAPDIEPYVPFIRSVFGREIPFRIEEVRRPQVGSAAEAWGHLVALVEGRWEASRLVALLGHPALLDSFSDEEMEQVRLWIDEAQIRWGRDRVHRAGVQGMSWVEGLEQLARRIALDIEPGLWDLLERLLMRVEALLEALGPLGSEELTLGEWKRRLCAISEQFLETQLSFDFPKIEEQRYGWSSILPLLDVGSKHSIHGASLESVRFGSLLSLRAIPAKVVAVLGMEDFPRGQVRSHLDQIAGEPSRPSMQTTDRYLFLEALVSARGRFFASFCSVNGSDGMEQPMGVPLQELVRFAGLEVQRHPATRHHHSNRWFSEESHLRALACYGERRSLPGLVGEPFDLEGVELPEQMELWELEMAVRDPLRLYARHTLGITLPQELEVQDLEQISLGGWELQRLVWRALVEPIETLLGGVAPPFQGVLRSRLEREVAALRSGLSHHQLRLDDLEDLHLVEGLQVGGTRIVGSLRRVSDRGLLLLGKGDAVGRMRSYPSLLLSAALDRPARLLWTESDRVTEFDVGDPAAKLRTLALFAERCKRQPCPLSSGWMSHLLTGSPRTPTPSLYSSWLGVETEENRWRPLVRQVFDLFSCDS